MGKGTKVKIIILLLFLSPVLAFAAPVSLDLHAVSIPDLSRIVLKEMLGKDYVISPDVLKDEQKISVTLMHQEKPQILEVVKSSLAAIGLEIVEVSDVFYVQKHATASAAGVSPAGQPSAPLPVLPVRYYQIKSRDVIYLGKVAAFAGASVADVGGRGEFLIYSGTEEVLDRVDKLLKVADIAPQAITIRAALVEFNETSDKGRSLSMAISALSQKLGIAYKAGQALSNSISFSGATVQAAMSAIEGDSRFNYLAEPLIRVLDGQQARLMVGSDVPIRGTVTVDKNGNPVQSIDYRTSGIVIAVQPQINGENISLSIDQQISSFGNTTTSNIDSPTLFKRQAQTVVDIKRGQLLVLAGLDEDKSTTAKTGLPFLPNFLHSESSNKSRSQILLLLEVLNDI